MDVVVRHHTVNFIMKVHMFRLEWPACAQSFDHCVWYPFIVAEIQIVIAEEMADKDIQFPVSKSPEDDYIQISGSSFKKAG